MSKAPDFASRKPGYAAAWGIASRIGISATYVSRQVMQLAISVTGPGTSAAAVQGTAMPDSGWLWREYKA